ncbi:TrbI F-type domain-containing protein (plasmid) [Bermanella marisrubri]|uniref:Type-F conjugative transfer system protein TrbI n=1 Tax=Bermanella marisrubri TaxID=207949 RepID=Q1MY38_9GAMM|nr:TrbI F-type domain-containing protein [Bermanella marisrubri]EAT10858.1 hypothetical protein RED65_01928 [Oceanobacter sp. RED65] [Bermanella marisrubri]QIZ85911.1 TrbI F-type domain-containing protein [Bermanella marisrubri]
MNIRNLVFTLGISVLVSLASSFLVVKLMVPEIKSVSLDKLLDNHIAQVKTKYEMTDEEVNTYSEAFSLQVEKTLDAYGEGDTIIIVSPAVVRGTTDITDDVYASILENIESK